MKKKNKIFKAIIIKNIDGIDEITIKYKKNKKKYLTDSENEEIKESYGEMISEKNYLVKNLLK